MPWSDAAISFTGWRSRVEAARHRDAVLSFWPLLWRHGAARNRCFWMRLGIMTTHPHHRQAYKYYDLILGAFITVYLCSNLIGPAKAVSMWGFTFGAGVLFFPISYIFGDVL